MVISSKRSSHLFYQIGFVIIVCSLFFLSRPALVSRAVDINGASGPDNIRGTITDDDIRGRNGQDTIDGLDGNDEIEYNLDCMFFSLKFVSCVSNSTRNFK